MQVTKKQLAAFLVADALVIAAGVYVVARMVSVDEAVPAEERREAPREEPAVRSNDARQKAAEAAPQRSCEDRERAAVEGRGTKYESGSVLVTFHPSVTFSQAKAFLDAKGLKLHTTASPDDFADTHWLSVRVPKGEEFDWICSLSSATEVRRAGVNPVFDLAD